jgi:hypothetical protein
VSQQRQISFAPLLSPHLLERISNIERADLLVILKFEGLVATMPGHVHENVRSVVRQKTLGAGYGFFDASYKHFESIEKNQMDTKPINILMTFSTVISTIIDLDVIPIQIEVPSRVGIYATLNMISRFTCKVVGKHEDDIRVGVS